MPEQKQRFLVFMSNPEKRLFYIANHESDTSTAIGFQSIYSKGASILRQMSEHGEATDSTNKSANHNFAVILALGGIKGWQNDFRTHDVSAKEAMAVKKQLVEQYESEGWTYLGHLYNPPVKNGLGIDTWSNTKIPNKTKDDFYRYFEMITCATQDRILQRDLNIVKINTYLAVQRTHLNKKAELIHYIHEEIMKKEFEIDEVVE
jgi:hypothetical protein